MTQPTTSIMILKKNYSAFKLLYIAPSLPHIVTPQAINDRDSENMQALHRSLFSSLSFWGLGVQFKIKTDTFKLFLR